MSSDPKPREGTETLRRRIRDLFPRIGRQTQNPERGRKLPRRLAITTPTNGRQTQNPERGRKLDTDMTAVPHLTQSSDPKPREGTETRMVGKLALGSESSRQTQNPERGRKPASGKSVRSKRFQRVVRPKTPRGDGNSKSSTTSAAAACSRSRQTQNPERGRKLNNTFFERGAVESVVRPKTPRGDGNNAGDDFRCCGSHCRQTQNPERGRKRTPAPPLTIRQIRRRQTQNPERGRKLAGSGLRVLTSPVVVRPKTPRGDGNPTTSSGIQSHGYARSSDPKPREGTETCIHSSPTRRTSASRQTQNPERGRKLVIASRRAWRADCRQTQNPERGRKHHPTQAPKSMTSRRQTQNPERGRKLVRHLCLIQVQCPVVRPKTPRGDGNLTARSFPASIR
ncbi:Uncharacterised protein [Mycobacterium tuberculosis]|nr:Uncharacterised protein [Mycobacterium tuberculosis]CKY37000.1 Uncharacterised protein [Mycobacterium tuberculosis]CKY42260.1 Uncharacterised protein [Mycobacterium tuberculosis]